MLYYIYRNNTIEPLFKRFNIRYSGYGDISSVDLEADAYIWFYQTPFHFSPIDISEEILDFANKLEWIHRQIPDHKDLLVFSLVDFRPFKWIDSEWNIQESIDAYNGKIRSLALLYRNVKYIDFSEFTSRYSSNQLWDWKFYFISQMGFNPKLGEDFSVWFMNKLRGLSSHRKKCLVLDLDNTLWGGILGEDGIEGIKIGGDYPGKAFSCFQEGLLELSKRGIILTVCSKNNEHDVLEAWDRNPFMVLRKDSFSAYRINWQNKAENIKELSEELNIGLDSMVFIDDNPSERELVKQMLPMVEVPDVPMQPYMLPSFLMSLSDKYFQIYSITEEDRRKTEQYRANAIRQQERKKFVDFKDYLSSLGLEIQIESMNVFNQSRIAQMTQKTNQFNLTTRRYVETDLGKFIKEGWLIYSLRVKDRFGDNGITGAIFLKPNSDQDTYEIDALLLSCRILGKGIEFAFLYSILNLLRNKGVRKIIAQYIPTEKNGQTASFYDQSGFVLLRMDEQGNKYYQINLDFDKVIEPYYKIEYIR